ncbi:MAG: hypothetical protein WC485_11275 [Opitutaceae bacterium]
MRSETIKHPTRDLYAAYGKDHACGWFLQIWDVDEEGEDHYLVDADQTFGGIETSRDVPRILTEHGFDVARDFYGVGV